jgi:hypothetical protein
MGETSFNHYGMVSNPYSHRANGENGEPLRTSCYVSIFRSGGIRGSLLNSSEAQWKKRLAKWDLVKRKTRSFPCPVIECHKAYQDYIKLDEHLEVSTTFDQTLITADRTKADHEINKLVQRADGTFTTSLTCGCRKRFNTIDDLREHKVLCNAEEKRNAITFFSQAHNLLGSPFSRSATDSKVAGFGLPAPSHNAQNYDHHLSKSSETCTTSQPSQHLGSPVALALTENCATRKQNRLDFNGPEPEAGDSQDVPFIGAKPEKSPAITNASDNLCKNPQKRALLRGKVMQERADVSDFWKYEASHGDQTGRSSDLKRYARWLSCIIISSGWDLNIPFGA